MEFAPFSLRLTSPLSTANGELRERRGFLVGVTDDAGGVVGVGEATPLPGWTESYEECETVLRELPTDLDGWDAAVSGSPAASHGVQQALIDAEARERGVTLATQLCEHAGIDAAPAESVPVNATVGDGSVAETVDAAEAAVVEGYDCLKLKVGARGLDADLDRVRAVVDAVDATVRVDANAGWDRQTAARAVDALASLDVEYVEQPLPADDLAGMASLRGRGVDVAVDESLASRGAKAVLDADAADVAVLKPMALGGPGAALGLARRLGAAGVDPVVTTTVDGAVARAAAVHVAACVPDVRACGLATGGLLAEDLSADPVPVENGRIRVPDGPGTAGERFDSLV